MNTLEERLKQSSQITQGATLIGMLVGISLGLLLAAVPGFGLWKGVYAGAITWLASYGLAVQVLTRRSGRLRPLTAWILGAAVFFGSLLYLQGVLQVLLIPLGLAYLVKQAINGAAYLVNPYASLEDRQLDRLASRKAQADPAAARKLLQELLTRHQKKLVKAMQSDLGKTERQPGNPSAAQRCRHMIDLLTLGGEPPAEYLPLVGRAYLGVARYQVATQAAGLLETLKKLKDYPLPAGGVAFRAEQYAARHARDNEAVQAYLDFIREQSANPVLQSRVYLEAYESCAITQADDPARLKEVEGIARAFFEADARLSWAALRLGQSLLWQGKPGEAVGYLEKAAERMPGNTEALYSLGEAHQELGQIELAEAAYRKVLALAPTHLETWYALGSLLVAGGRAETLPAEQRQQVLAEARLYLSAVIASQPGRAGAHYGLGLVSYAEGNYAGARHCFEQALSLDASRAEWHYQQARALIELKDFPAAMKAVQQAIDLDAAYRPALRLLSEELLRQGRWAEAEAAYQALVALGESGVEIAAGLGRALYEQGRDEEAVKVLKSSSEPHRERLFYLGRAHAHLGDFSAGVLAYQKAISHAGPDAELMYWLGCALASAGKYRPALESLRQALKLNESAQTYTQIGNIHTAQGDWEAAQAAIHKGLELAPSAAGWYALAMCWARMGQAQQAEHALQQALELDQGYRPAWMAQGALLEASGDLAGAQSAYEQAASLGAADANTQLRIGALANRRGLHEQALGLLLAARQAGELSDRLLYHLGMAQARSGQWDGAIEAWGLLSERHPDDKALSLGVADCRWERGRQRFTAGNYAEAIEDWEACLGSRKAQPGLRNALGEAAFRQAAGWLQAAAADTTCLEEARAALRKAQSYSKRGEERLAWLEALLYLVEGDFQAAAEGFGWLYKAAKDDRQLAYHLGYALFRNGQPGQAVPYLQQALDAPLSAAQRQAVCLMLAEQSAAGEQWIEAAELYRMGFEMQAAPVGG